MKRAITTIVLSLAIFVSGSAASPQSQNTPEIIHLLNRIGFGPRPGDVERVAMMGIEKYVEQQLYPERIDDSAAHRRIDPFETLQLSSSQLIREYPRGRQARGGNRPQAILQELVAQKVVRAVYSERQLQEVMTDFWFNHFNVFWGKGTNRWLTTDFELNAIRPHALGKFKDLLMATAKSPAMMVYLDNFQSVSPDPRLAARRPQANRKPGINENYAREIMELHTLGVDGGYTQQDVQEVARAFTGWSVGRPAGEFLFRPAMHDRGEKTVLGHKLEAGGIEDGEQVIDILAGHPSTARFIAAKLVRRFVNDTPPQALVDRVAATFTKTGGDIREMLRVILLSPEFSSPENRHAKTKSPFELAVSAIRALGGTTDGGLQLGRTIARMGQPLYQYQPPTGFPDSADHWMNTGSLVERINFGIALTENKIPGTRVELSGFADAKAASLYLGSPEFQKR